MSELTSVLTEQEADDFIRLRNQAASGWHNLSTALLEIRDRRLYRENFKSFEEFCKKEYGMNRANAYHAIQAVETVNQLSPSAAEKIKNEGQARALRSIPEEIRETVLDAIPAAEVTATKIKETAEAIAEKTQESVPEIAEALIRYDEPGYPIPDSLIELWDKAKSEGNRLQKLAAALRDEIKDAVERKERYMFNLRNTLPDEVDKIRYALGEIKPYAVCPYCDGTQLIKKLPCQSCRGRGFVSKHTWETVIPKDVKEARV